MPEQPTIAETLGMLRGKRGLEKQEVAQAINVLPKTYASWESGRTEPSATNIVKLASFHGVSTDYLLGVRSHPLGLEPDSWIIDLDQVSKPERNKLWCIKVPRRYRIASYEEMREIERQEGL